jgi:hypothetical protein
MALALEARGLFFYTYTARDWQLAETSLWPELKSLVQELRSHSALFAQPPLWWPADVDYVDSERMYNEVHDGVILSRLYHLPKAAGELSPGYYFLVVNTTRETLGYSFRVPFADVASAEFGAESLRPDRWLRREYKPFEVALLGPFHNPTFKND